MSSNPEGILFRFWKPLKNTKYNICNIEYKCFKTLLKEPSLWANYISSHYYSKTFKHFQHSSEAWHTKCKSKFPMWV